MAKKSYRRKAAEAASPPGASSSARPVDPNVALFASRVKEAQARERAAKSAARAERRAADEHQRLVDAKDAAAAELKRLRREGGAGAARVAAADVTYRAALAALIANETGEAPAWAPPAAAPAAATEPSESLARDDASEPAQPDPEAGVEATSEPEGDVGAE